MIFSYEMHYLTSVNHRTLIRDVHIARWHVVLQTSGEIRLLPNRKLRFHDIYTCTLRQKEISPSDVQIVEIRFISANSI